jgi:hypothetical protein
VSDEGPIEKVPLKVVPYYVDPEPLQLEPGVPVDPVVESGPVVELVETAPRRRFPFLGATALVLAVLTAAVHVAALVASTAGDIRLGTVFAFLAIGLSIISVASGIVSIIVDRIRWPGIAAIPLGVLANPFLLLQLLRWVEQTAAVG